MSSSFFKWIFLGRGTNHLSFHYFLWGNLLWYVSALDYKYASRMTYARKPRFSCTSFAWRLELRNRQMEEMYKARYMVHGVGECEEPVGVHHSPSTSMCSSTQKLSKFRRSRVFITESTAHPPPFPPLTLGWGGWLEGLKVLTYWSQDWFFPSWCYLGPLPCNASLA